MASRGKKSPDESEESTLSSTLVETARGLAEIVSTHNLSELILDTKELTLTVRRGGFAPAPAAAPVQHVMQAAPPSMLAPSIAAPVDDKSHVVTSPFVGTFYRKPNPDSPNYVSLHDKVDKGAVLCIVEAMKLMNEIEADIAGTVIAILVEDGSPVEYGQALFRIAA
jgi:acetyl-CoA carboxylase biotin carboxyl carrier protein